MSILKPINYAGAWEFKRPVPCPVSDILGAPLVSISFNEDWIPAVMSAMKALTRPESYEGTLSDINRCTKDAHNLFILSGASMPVGTIVPHMLSTLPSNWLNCDGATHLRVDYPELYAIIDAAYIIDADHFKTPDLRGRSPLGVGSGSGLTTRAVNAMGGEETHVLSVAELAQHSHTYTELLYTPAAVIGPSQFLVYNYQFSNSGSTGSNSPHNTMHPFTAVKYAVVAL